MADLGKLERLDETGVRRIWPREDQNFSPWLADNIGFLNEALNISIEITQAEVPVENFRLDLEGMDSVSQRPVVIENQFGRSDHDHLGKLITYAAGREAGINIWIANEFQSPHRNAIEWLNRISPSELSFYAIELEVLKIDESRPATNFRIIAGPPPSKRKEIPSGDQVSPRNRQYQEFFDRLRAVILQLDSNFTRAKGLPQSWWSLGIGRTGFALTAAFTADAKFRIEIYIDLGVKDDNEYALTQLRENETLIEERIEQPLVWDYLPESRACRVYVSIDGTIDDAEKHEELLTWGAPMMVKFREIFSPLIRNLDLKSAV